jgi:hypothetical protein
MDEVKRSINYFYGNRMPLRLKIKVYKGVVRPVMMNIEEDMDI